MKTIGLIGGLSWESSVEYYRIINQETQHRLGGIHSAPCLLYSFDFGEIETLQAAGDWAGAGARMVDAARKLRLAGAEAVILGCTDIGLLIKPADSALPTFDTTELHALAAVDWALED